LPAAAETFHAAGSSNCGPSFFALLTSTFAALSTINSAGYGFSACSSLSGVSWSNHLASSSVERIAGVRPRNGATP
jgi:hypothetical protein